MFLYYFMAKYNSDYEIEHLAEEIARPTREEVLRKNFKIYDYDKLKENIKASIEEQISDRKGQKVKLKFTYDDWTENLIYTIGLRPYRKCISQNILAQMEELEFVSDKSREMFMTDESFLINDVINTYLDALKELKNVYNYSINREHNDVVLEFTRE